MGPSTVPSALRCIAEDLLLRAKHVEEMDTQLQAADVMAEAIRKCADGLHAGFLNKTEVAESLDLALADFDKLRNPLGIKIKVDPSLQPGEWRIEK